MYLIIPLYAPLPAAILWFRSEVFPSIYESGDTVATDMEWVVGTESTKVHPAILLPYIFNTIWYPLSLINMALEDDVPDKVLNTKL